MVEVSSTSSVSVTVVPKMIVGSQGTPPKRPPSSTGSYANYGDSPPVPPLGTPYRRSLSRASMASSRPWSPVTSTSTTQSSQPTRYPVFRPPSRAQTPAGPSRGLTSGLGTTPRSRPKTPSHIPGPSKFLKVTPKRSENSEDEDSPGLQRALSPTMSVTSSGFGHPPRPPSGSMIPVPSLQLSMPSRPFSSMTFRGSAARAQTPEHTLRANVQRIALFPGTVGRSAARPSLVTKLPPSSFKVSTASRAPSSSGSRAGAYTLNMDNLTMYEYIPGTHF
ncbi:hypothetical protein H0H87_005262 [Tephrocybe sp. NHM501043]|nr:hypothetical protein H0H87_005262 [Tephrocybe sp. NHM501043]